jgi:hypothetical protein
LGKDGLLVFIVILNFIQVPDKDSVLSYMCVLGGINVASFQDFSIGFPLFSINSVFENYHFRPFNIKPYIVFVLFFTVFLCFMSFVTGKFRDR